MSVDQVLVTGLRRGGADPLSLYRLILHLEDKRSCPCGGEVEEDKCSPQDEDSVIITFSDPSVASRIAALGELTVADHSVKVTLYYGPESHESSGDTEIKSDDPNPHTDKWASGENEGVDDYSISSSKDEEEDTEIDPPGNKSVGLMACNSLSSSVFEIRDSDEECDSNETSKDDLQMYDSDSSAISFDVKKSPEILKDQKVEQVVSSSDTGTHGEAGKLCGDLQNIPSVGGNCENTAVKNRDVTSKDENMVKKNISHESHEPIDDISRNLNQGSQNAGDHSKNSIKFEISEDEKFFLLYRTSLYGGSNDILKSDKSLLRFDQEAKEIYISYSDAQTLDAVKEHLYEVIANAHQIRFTDCSKEVVEFLSTPMGMQLADRILVENKLAATVYTKSGRIFAQDERQGDKALKVICENIVSERMCVDGDKIKFLQSKRYVEKVADLRQGKTAAINLSERRTEILIIGMKDEVEDVKTQLNDLLNRNREITVKVIEKAPVLRLLQTQYEDDMARDIKKCLEDGGCAVDFQFEAGNISLTGLQSDVKAARDLITTDYISRIKHEKFEVCQPGVRIENFHTRETEEAKLITKLNKKHKAYIDVEENAVSESVVLSGNPAATDQSKTQTGDKISDKKSGSNKNWAKSVLSSAVRHVASFVTAAPATQSPATINLVRGNITEFKDADVLVNPLATNATRLLKCGAVAKGFFLAGGSQIEEELKKVGYPREFGTDVSVTMATGNLQAKKIFHMAIRSHKNDKSVERLLQSITTCLNQVVQEGLTSIAFPTLGCGRLNYDPTDVANAFVQAVGQITTNLKVYIICFPNDGPYDAFDKIVNQTGKNKSTASTQAGAVTSTTAATAAASATATAAVQPIVTATALDTAAAAAAAASSSATSADVSNDSASSSALSSSDGKAVSMKIVKRTLCFQIYSLSETAANDIRAKLIEFFHRVSKEKKIEAPDWNVMSTFYQRKILALNSLDVTVSWDEKDNQITIRGAGPTIVSSTKKKIKNILDLEEKEGGLERIKRAKGVPEYLRAISYLEEIPYPSYWKQIQDPTSVRDCKVTDLDPQSDIYKAVEEMVVSTWTSGVVGTGSDAKGLTHKNIVIKKISVIENPELFRDYFIQKKKLCGKASHSLFSSFNGFNGESEVQTVTKLSGELMMANQLTSEINEYYFLHGTSSVREISTGGLDFRFSSDKVMFGRGAYFAESSTKADQYADNRSNRSAAGKLLHMFVVRVPLGQPHVTKEPYSFRKPPCADPTCSKLDKCVEHAHGDCHSVIGVQRWVDKDKRAPGSATARLLFREFIVYEYTQCYPDFLVAYVRV